MRIALISTTAVFALALLAYGRSRDQIRTRALRQKARTWGLGFSQENPFIDLRPRKRQPSSLLLAEEPVNHLTDLIEVWMKHPTAATYLGLPPTACFPFIKREHLKIQNVMWGMESAIPYRIFDMQLDGTDTSESAQKFTCVLANIGANWPTTQISHANELSRLRDEGAMIDVDLPSTQFNEAFHVRSIDPEFAAKLFNGAVRELITAESKLITDLYFSNTWMLGVRPLIHNASKWNAWREFVREFGLCLDENVRAQYPVPSPNPMTSGEPILIG